MLLIFYKYILLWGQRIWGPWPISYLAQGPRRGGRNSRERTKGIQTARIYYQGRPCPRQTKKRYAARGNPLEHPKGSFEPSGPAIGA